MLANKRGAMLKSEGPLQDHWKKPFTITSNIAPSRRDVLAGSAAAGAMVLLRGESVAATDGKKTFTILHTNDLHSNFIGMSPEADYTLCVPRTSSALISRRNRLTSAHHDCAARFRTGRLGRAIQVEESA